MSAAAAASSRRWRIRPAPPSSRCRSSGLARPCCTTAARTPTAVRELGLQAAESTALRAVRVRGGRRVGCRCSCGSNRRDSWTRTPGGRGPVTPLGTTTSITGRLHPASPSASSAVNAHRAALGPAFRRATHHCCRRVSGPLWRTIAFGGEAVQRWATSWASSAFAPTPHSLSCWRETTQSCCSASRLRAGQSRRGIAAQFQIRSRDAGVCPQPRRVSVSGRSDRRSG